MRTNKEILNLIEPNKRPLAANLLTEIRFIKTTLAQLRKEIREKGPTEHFVNGSQEFDRETPAMKTYNATVGKYAQLHKQLADLIPDGQEIGDELDEFMKVW